MWFGKEKINRKERCLHVTNKGFISLYGVMLLLIFLCLVTLVVQRISTFQSVLTLEDEYDIYAIRKGYHLFQEWKKINSQKQIEGLSEEDACERSEFLGVNYKFVYAKEKITVYYDSKNASKSIEIYFDEEDGDILSVVYL